MNWALFLHISTKAGLIAELQKKKKNLAADLIKASGSLF